MRRGEGKRRKIPEEEEEADIRKETELVGVRDFVDGVEEGGDEEEEEKMEEEEIVEEEE